MKHSFVMLVAWGLCGVVAAAENDGQSDAQQSDAELQQVIASSADEYVKAYQAADPEALGELFTPQAEYVDATGMVFHGRETIQAEFAAMFASRPPGTVRIQLLSIRPIAQGVLVEDGISSFSAEVDEGSVTSQTRYTATHVRQSDGSWKIASIRELQSDRMAPHDRLEALAWLLGDWHEDVAGSVISTSWNWSNDKNFLIAEFSIELTADVVTSGTHRIGWDAERSQFHSWIFESQGGAAEGWWRENEDGSWSLHINGVDAEGVRRSSVLTYSADGPNAMVVSQTERQVGGQSLPDSAHRIVVQPPPAEPQANSK